LGWVRPAIYDLGLDLKNFTIKHQFFPFGSKKSLWVGSKSTPAKGGSASYLLRVKSMLGSGQGPSLSLRDFSQFKNISDEGVT